MLFNSPEFLFAFLPISILGYIGLRKSSGQKHIFVWLTLCSLFFYSWWNFYLSWIITFSIIFNFFAGKKLQAHTGVHKSKWTLVAILINLTPLIYYKYSVFALQSFSSLLGQNRTFEALILPLGISFFTFQQITYIIDAHKGIAKEYKFFHYSTFVTFFPQLIAGPIVHHTEMMPQFDKKTENIKTLYENLAVGMSILIIGLFKKVVIADNLALEATPVFLASQSGSVDFFLAWRGALGYTFQLYFDFSGYSDMAIGIARMFGILLPANFLSPYKASNIIEFWRCWHMTLSRFLKDYIYIPLGGSRQGNIRRYTNLMTTMVLGGLWHGAGWTFIFWGFLHGVYLSINHLWNHCIPPERTSSNPIFRLSSWLLTFTAVAIGWIFFRATTFPSAIEIIKGMAFLNGAEMPQGAFPLSHEFANTIGLHLNPYGGTAFMTSWLKIFSAIAIALFGKNLIEIFSDYQIVTNSPYHSTKNSFIRFSPTFKWALFLGVLWYLALSTMFQQQSSEFLYFNF